MSKNMRTKFLKKVTLFTAVLEVFLLIWALPISAIFPATEIPKTTVAEYAETHAVNEVTDEEFENQLYQKSIAAKAEMGHRKDMVGRLNVPSVGIDVALIRVNPEKKDAQAITDAYDSAAYMDGYLSKTSIVIADHNYQAFKSLAYVGVGCKAKILEEDSVISLVCTIVCDAYNTGHGIVDENGESVADIADYVCYTCKDNCGNVRVVGFSVES